MEDKAKNVLIGVLVVIAVVSLFFSIKGVTTGQAVKEVSGILEVRPAIAADVDVYVNDKFAMNVERGKRPYYTLEAGTYKIIVKSTGQEDYTETINIVPGESTIIYPWMPTDE